MGFSFDSDDDADDLSKSALPTNQNEDAEEQSNGKTKKKTQKASVCCLGLFSLSSLILYHLSISSQFMKGTGLLI